MNQLEFYVTQIEEQLKQNDFPIEPRNLYDPLRYFLNLGGKRIRPVLTLLGAELFEQDVIQAMPAAMAIEYFHNFSLIHDDIMDQAPLRRAKATIHTKWDANIAILSGDVLLVKAYQQLCKQNSKHLEDLLQVFNRTAIEVCEGQQMDMDFEQRNHITQQEYIEMIRLKTSVLLGCALEFGAIISNASLLDRARIYSFGMNLGIAFQIQDDLLDLYADSEKFGKQVGGDVMSNKKTILLLKALELANETQKEAIYHAIGQKDPIAKVKAVTSQFDELGVKQAVLELRDYYFELGIKALQDIEIKESNKKNLFALIDFLKQREV